MSRILDKAASFVTAWAARYGEYPSKNATLLLMGVADLETGLGDYRGNFPGAILDGPSHNWGQIQFAPLNAQEKAMLASGTIPPPRSAHAFLSGDTSPDTGAYHVWLWRFDNDIEGANKLLEVIVDHEKIRETIDGMTATDLARSMYAAHYFEGSHSRSEPGGPEKNIAAYAASIASHARAIAAALGGEWQPTDVQGISIAPADPPASGGGGGSRGGFIAGVILLALTGAATYFATRSG